MKILIVDDEPLARTRLCRLIEGIPGMTIAGTAGNGLEALALAARLEPDIVLLDIRMPEMDGLEAAQHLGQLEKPPAVIFTTAYDNHALAAFETQAVDYLVKPIRQERLIAALGKAQKINRAQLIKLAEAQNHPHARKFLNVGTQNRIDLVPVDEILYLQADQKYVTVRHINGSNLIEESLKSLEDEFQPQFIRIHRNALAARKFV
ncbi:MAG: DNA-binding response regulator, partial [Gammaproteobacteria bacterium RBG_16_57_12]